MPFNVDAFLRDGCAAAGIPEIYVSTVLARAGETMTAVSARGRGKTREQRIAALPRSICQRVLAQAVADLAAGRWPTLTTRSGVAKIDLTLATQGKPTDRTGQHARRTIHRLPSPASTLAILAEPWPLPAAGTLERRA